MKAEPCGPRCEYFVILYPPPKRRQLDHALAWFTVWLAFGAFVTTILTIYWSLP